MNPISEAKVTISCGENVYKCYSNETGYYHKEGLPLVFCIWNITCSKPGYKMAYVEMPIGENTTYDFVLTSLNTIYVDDDNIQGPWDGTQKYPYRYIQDAIDNASERDTIFVYNGTYFENLIIGTLDSKAGACGSLRNIVQDYRLNHYVNVTTGILSQESSLLLKTFFQKLRKEKKNSE